MGENQKNLNNINFLLKFNHKVQLKLSKKSPVRQTPPTYQQNPQPTSVPVTVNVPVPQQCHTQYVHHSYPAVPTQNNYYHSYPTVTETLDSSDIAFLSEFTFSY